MKKFMCIGDLHWRGDNPPYRKDNYREDIRACNIEALLLAEQLGCEAVVLLGDVFNFPEPAGTIRNEVIDIFSQHPKGRPWKFITYALIGNHDVIGHDPNTLYRTALGTLGKVSVQIVPEVPELSLYCGHYSHGIEHADHTQSKMRVYAMHANILPKTFPSNDYILLSQFKTGQNCQLVITGHYHDGYDIITRDDGVIFCNPGAIARDDATRSNIERTVQVAVITLHGDRVEVEYVPLQSARPGIEIFNLEAIYEARSKRKDRRELSRKLDEVREKYEIQVGTDPETDFKTFSSIIGVSDNAVQLILTELHELRELRKRKN